MFGYCANDVRINIQSFLGLSAVLLKLTSKSITIINIQTKRNFRNTSGTKSKQNRFHHKMVNNQKSISQDLKDVIYVWRKNLVFKVLRVLVLRQLLAFNIYVHNSEERRDLYIEKMNS